MTPERHKQIGELCQAALEREPEQRDAFLDEACTGDQDLRQEVESLLAADAQAGNFIAKPALEMAAEVMAAQQARKEDLVRIGQTLAHYCIEEQIGRGGMGVVYRATDTKLGRQVAIKVLPQIFASDPERLARFEREARMLASLNHPNIAAIYGVEESHEMHCLVLELAPGEDLNRRLVSGPLPIEEAVAICRQIAESLEAAHEKDIIHRDLKPSNVKVTPEGKVKVLDFGLAKAVHGNLTDSGSPGTVDDTLKGVVLGTAAYMSPEQARGKSVDKRTDIWAFGCVLYETLAGRRAFAGETTSDCMAAVLTREPDWTALPVDTPRSILRLLHRCLQKDPQRRLRDIGDARIELEDALSEPKMDVQALSSGLQFRRLAWTALALVTLIIALAVVWIRRPVPTAPLVPEARFELSTPPTNDPVSLAISPDGQKIVFVAVSEGRSPLWIRSLDSASARPLAGTDSAMFPFWSPNSRSVGFFAQGKLKRIDTASGFVETLANASAGRGGSWSPDGTIIFSASPSSPIFRLPPTGGEPVALTRLDLLHHGNHRFPHFLPDGKHFLYYAQGTPETHGVYVGELDGPGSRLWLDAADPFRGAVWFSDGNVLFLRNGTLFAQNFDPVRLALAGTPFPVAAPPPGGPPIRVVSASAAGLIAYRMAPGGGGLRQLAWFDRSGKEIEIVGGPGYGIQPELSPDGRFVAMRINPDGNNDITLLEMGRSVLTRFTFDPGIDIRGIWSPDGSRIVFCSNRKGVYNLYWKLTTGPPGSEEPLLEMAQPRFPHDWSLDGRFLLYGQEEKSGNDLWVLPLDGDRKSFPVVQTNYDEVWGQFSPDGKWIAYASNESGQYEIYVQPVSGKSMVGGKRQISVNGGSFVRWRRDGKELFYIAPDNRLMAVTIRLARDRPAVESDAPIPLFATRLGGAWQAPPGREYVVSPDGRRFLMNTSIEEPISPISVILNWKAKR